MRVIARLAALATLPLLAGCFDANISLTAQPDGTASVVAEIALAPPEQMLALMFPPDTLAALPAEQKDALVAQLADQLQADYCAPNDADVPEGVTVTVDTNTRDDGYMVCRETMTGPIATVAEATAAGALEGGTQGLQLTLTDDGNGTYTFHVLIPAAGDASAAAALGDDTAAMMAAALDGHFITWSVTAPRIIDTTGDLNGNTATYTVPAGAVLGQATDAYEFTVHFSL